MPYAPKRPALDPCPVEEVLDVVGGKWKGRLLLLLAGGLDRLSELQRALPRTPKQVLITQLLELEAAGVVEVTIHQQGGRTSRRYALSARGWSLMPVLDVMAEWGLGRLVERGLAWAPPAVARDMASGPG